VISGAKTAIPMMMTVIVSPAMSAGCRYQVRRRGVLRSGGSG